MKNFDMQKLLGIQVKNFITGTVENEKRWAKSKPLHAVHSLQTNPTENLYSNHSNNESHMLLIQNLDAFIKFFHFEMWYSQCLQSTIFNTFIPAVYVYSYCTDAPFDWIKFLGCTDFKYGLWCTHVVQPTS